MNKEEFLKAIENVPKTDSINTISAYNSINVEDLANAVDRFKKIPTYDELLKENQELKKQVEEYQQELEKADSITQSCIFNGKKESKISYRKCLNILDKKETQQKEFIEWLETMNRMYQNEYKDIDTAEHYNCVLQKYKEIIGGK